MIQPEIVEALFDTKAEVGRCEGTLALCSDLMSDFSDSPNVVRWALHRVQAAQERVRRAEAFLSIMVPPIIDN